MSPDQALDISFTVAERSLSTSFVPQDNIRERIEYVCQCGSNRAGVRLLMSCLLAKQDNQKIDPRKPYTAIGGADSFFGRSYDESYISPFIVKNRLPVNRTTAFLTPALRNISSPLSVTQKIEGKPPKLYTEAIQVLDNRGNSKISILKLHP